MVDPRTKTTGKKNGWLMKAHHRGTDEIRWSLGLERKHWSGPITKNAQQKLFSVGRLLGPGITLFSAVQGFQEGGVGGAVKGVVENLVSQYAFGAIAPIAMKAVGVGAAAAGIYGAAYSAITGRSFSTAYRPLFRKQLLQYRREHAKLEMGQPVVDPYGTVSTMRQRSVMAIQESKFNGRGALGNEAIMMNRPYFR